MMEVNANSKILNLPREAAPSNLCHMTMQTGKRVCGKQICPDMESCAAHAMCQF